MMPRTIANRYKAVQVKTSSPGEILVLLFEAASRHVAEAAQAMRAGERGRAAEGISRVHAILAELNAGLRTQYAPELCARLRALYFFAMTTAVEANIHNDPERLDAVGRVLDPLRDAFTQAVRANAATVPEAPVSASV